MLDRSEFRELVRARSGSGGWGGEILLEDYSQRGETERHIQFTIGISRGRRSSAAVKISDIQHVFSKQRSRSYMDNDTTPDAVSSNGPVDRNRAAENQDNFLCHRIGHRRHQRDDHLHLLRAGGDGQSSPRL